METASSTSGARPPDITLDTNDLANAMRHISVATTAPDTYSPMSSAPPTPNLKTPVDRRTSHSATSPIIGKESPRPQHATVRRPSSSASLNKVASTSSPRLMSKSSRTSIGGTQMAEEQDKRPTPKRSISNLIAGLREAQSTMEAIEEPIPLTAPQIAVEHFTRELLGHARPENDSETVVILHDACYGHRYSRQKATKTALSMIVERPERIHASVLGASTAYVRLGEHHAGGRQAPHPDHTVLSPPPFKFCRTGRSLDITSSFVTNVHGTAWMSELRDMCNSASDKLAAGAKELSRSNVPGQVEKKQLHEGDLYLAPESLNAFQGALGGVADAVDAVFASGTRTRRAFVAVRPPGHHCSADHPSGFCWLNNVHVGIEYAAQTHDLTHAAILDFDLHHGDGSQAITWERNSKNNAKRTNAKPNSKLRLGPDIGYYSLHDINSYPCEMGDDEKVQAASLCIENAHGQSIWNVHLQPWKTEDEFWRLYESRYSVLLEKARLFLEHHTARIKAEGKLRPNSAIFISAGFDASEWEGAGMQRHKVSVPTEFYARFTKDVVQLAQSIEDCGGRVVSVLEGGYSDRALCSGVLSHLSGLCAVPTLPKTEEVEELAALSSQMSGLAIQGLGVSDPLQYNPEWWSNAHLTALEHKVNPPPPAEAKRMRIGKQPTYATPTESFAYKVVDPNNFARSISGTMRPGAVPVRPPTPPVPEVDWVVATQELSQLLIPIDRQTKSCTPEELAVARTKKDRHSVASVSTQEASQPRQLRGRKIKSPAYPESVHSDETANSRTVSRAESRSSRRETIDVLPSKKNVSDQKQTSRRQSSISGFDLSPSTSADTGTALAPFLPTAGTSNAGAMKPPPAPVPSTTALNKKIRAPIKPRAGTAAAAAADRQPATSTQAARPSTATGKTSDLDNLTSGMKKVTLKVSDTKEEHDRKQKEKLAADRSARAVKAAATRKVNAAAKKAAIALASTPNIEPSAISQKLPSANPQALPSPVIHALPTGLPAPPYAAPAQQNRIAADEPQAISEAQPAQLISMPDATYNGCGWGIVAAHSAEPKTNAIGQAISADLELHEYANSNESISPSLHPEEPVWAETGVTPTAASSSPGPLEGLPRHSPGASPSWPLPKANNSNGTVDVTATATGPEHAAYSPARPSGRNLPVWNSTGPIPFGNVPANAPQPPKSPPNALGQHVRADDSADTADVGTDMSVRPNGNDGYVQGLQQGEAEAVSIWDAPETPAK